MNKLKRKVLHSCFMLFWMLLAGFQPVSAAWDEIRTSQSGANSGWQYVVCGAGSGWQSCEVALVISLTAAPTSLVATGEQSTITATVKDAYGNSVGAGVQIGWTTTDGTLSASQTLTNASGMTSVILTSSNTIGGATVTATATTEGGAGSVYVTFTDKFNPYPPAYTAWVNTGAPYGCSAWSPDVSTVNSGQSFTQTRTCTQTQYRYRQDREISVVTGQIRNSGAPVAEYQAIYVNQSQTATGTKVTAPVCTYVGPGDHAFRYSHLLRWTSIPQYFNGVRLYDAYLLYIPGDPEGAKAYLYDGGYADYEGYRYTLGPLQFSGCLSRCEVEQKLFAYCKTPL